ncbi:MAG TPA: DUF1906 domain-containing protein [Gaiellaceae bacterium]
MKWGGALAGAAVLALATVAGASGASKLQASVYTGYGFDTCSAPSTADLQAWQASPYRAIGIYLGGVNRACADGNLSAGWVSAVTALGWSLMPLYVGLQAPCVADRKLQKITPDAAEAQGAAAADDAADRAAFFGIPTGSPITFDMEGYSTKDPSCTQAVQAFLAAWVNELHARGYVASVYGSAASTIRDAAVVSPLPDQVWIANWDGRATVFGDPYVSDSLWPDHQRIRQYKGGHKETWGGVTLNVDNDYVDSAVVGAAAAPPPPQPAVPPSGSVGSGDSQASAAWQAGTFPATAVVTLTPTPPPATLPPGYGAGGYAVALSVVDASVSPPTPIASFQKPVDVHVVPQPGPRVPLLSTDGGATWRQLPKLSGSFALPAGVRAAYAVNPDGSFDVLTLDAGILALLPDASPPAKPVVQGRFVKGALRLSWKPAADNSGRIGSYQVLLDGRLLKTVPGTARLATTKAFHPKGITVYRVQAVDAAGNVGKPSRPVVVVPAAKPTGVPRPIPHWAWQLFAFQHEHSGVRPKTPRPFPSWYWRWAGWRLQPFRLRS